jgi:hypothetical protein
MEACRWGSHSTPFAGIHGLVAKPIQCFIRPVDVRGEWDVAQLINQRNKIAPALEPHFPNPESTSIENLTFQLPIPEGDHLPHPNLTARFH